MNQCKCMVDIGWNDHLTVNQSFGVKTNTENPQTLGCDDCPQFRFHRAATTTYLQVSIWDFFITMR